MLGATTATSTAKELMVEEKLGLFSMPPRKARTSVGKLQTRDLVQDREGLLNRQNYPKKECTALGSKKLKNRLHNYHLFGMPPIASKPQMVVWSNWLLRQDSHT